MHILEFKAYYEPEIAAGIKLDADTAEALAAKGHYVHLYAPTPCRGISKELSKGTPKTELKFDGRLVIHRYSMYRERKGIIGRLFRYILCSIKQIYIGVREKKIDLLFAGSTPPFQGLIMAFLKKVKRVPFIYNLQDIFPESIITAGITHEDSVICKVGNWVSNITYDAADLIIVPSETMKRTLINKQIVADKIRVVPNWVDDEFIHPIERSNNRLVKKLKIPSYDFTVVYAGNLGYAQAVDIIVETAERLKRDRHIGFLIFGNGVYNDTMISMAAQKRLNNIHFYPLQQYESVSEVYSLGDACIVACKPGTGRNAMPSKIWSIMSCGRPVIASFDKESVLEEIISKEKCGVFAQAGDVDALIIQIKKLRQNSKLCKEMGTNARRYIEMKLSRKKSTERIVRIIEMTKEEYKSNESIIY